MQTCPRVIALLAALSLGLAGSAIARADKVPSAPQRPPRPISGPAQESLGHDLRVSLPAGYALLKADDARLLAGTQGRPAGDSLIAVLSPSSASGPDALPWFVEVSYLDAGYVKDDEPLDGAALLEILRARSPDVDGWAQPPRFDGARHRLLWAPSRTRSSGAAVRYHVDLLGRRGVASFTLVTSAEELAAARPHLLSLVAATQFDPGARYEDHQAQDRLSSWGLAALVAGSTDAAVKPGRGASAPRWWVIALALLAAGALVVRWFATGRSSRRDGG